MSIRKATLDDLPTIIEMGWLMHEESSFRNVEFCPQKVEKMAVAIITHGFAMMAIKDGDVVGAMLGDVVHPWYGNDRMGVDYALYIKPEYRGGMLAYRLASAFESWCIEMGAKTIRPGVSTGSMTAGKLYKAMGYEQVGECFVKQIGG